MAASSGKQDGRFAAPFVAPTDRKYIEHTRGMQALAEEQQKASPLFTNNDPETAVTTMESMCPGCEEQGTTRLMLLVIPFFREVILMSFYCEACGTRNMEIQAAAVQPTGVRHELSVSTQRDLNRQIVRGDAATLSIPELQFEIPGNTQKGQLNTVEGLLTKVVDDLDALQEYRDPETRIKVGEFIMRLRACLNLETPFTFILDDPSGNSFVESLTAPNPDPQLASSQYKRTPEQIAALGLGGEENFGAEGGLQAPTDAQKSAEAARIQEAASGLKAIQLTSDQFKNIVATQVAGLENEEVPEEVMVLPETCSLCYTPGVMKTMLTKIPHFKEVILMAFTCDHCGFKSTEIKSGGAVSELACRIELKVTSPEDMSRDVLKADTASLEIPELELELNPGTLGGKFTTVEGLLTNIIDELSRDNPFRAGDSSSERGKWTEFLNKMVDLRSGNIPFTFVIDDALSNSYVQNLYAPDPDPNLTITHYTRTDDQNEELGLNDMKVDGYEGQILEDVDAPKPAADS